MEETLDLENYVNKKILRSSEQSNQQKNNK